MRDSAFTRNVHYTGDRPSRGSLVLSSDSLMSSLRPLALPTYLVGFALAIIPPFDALMQVPPLRAGDPRWRFGAFGLLSNAMMIPLTGLLIIFIASTVFEHRRFQRVLGVLTLAFALAILGGLGLFLLDALQVRKDVNPAAALAFKVAFGTASLKATFGMITLAVFGIAAFRGPKAPRATSSRSENLIYGRQPGKISGAARPDDATAVTNAT